MTEYHTWCTTHHQSTSRWPGTYGRGCAQGNGSICETEVRKGVVKYWDDTIGHWVDAVDGSPWYGSRVQEYATQGRAADQG